jgi:hypothetical protein
MTPSLERCVSRLSKLQREYLVEHACGMHPFHNEPHENATRRSLVERGLIKYEPPTRSLLGIPHGTLLTPDGREVVCSVLAQYADALMLSLKWRDETLISRHLENQLRIALQECSAEWRKHELRELAINPPESKRLGHAYDRPAVSAKP